MVGRLGLLFDGDYIYGGINLRTALDGKTSVNVSASPSPVNRKICRLMACLASLMTGTRITGHTERPL